MLTTFSFTQSNAADAPSVQTDPKSDGKQKAQAPESELISPVVPLENGSA